MDVGDLHNMIKTIYDKPTANIILNRLFLSDSVLDDCMVLGVHPFFKACPVCWHVTIHSILMIVCISVISVVISVTFSPCVLLFFNKPGERLINFVFKKSALVFIDLFF